MTVASLEGGRVEIAGNGVTNSVAIPFQFVDETDLKVTHIDAADNETVWSYQQAPGFWDFTGGGFSAGTVTFTASAVAAGEKLVVELVSEFAQPYELDGGEIDGRVIENALDRQAISLQALAADVSYIKTLGYVPGDLSTALAGKVDKVVGKQLSTEDYTSDEKTKLSGVETGADVTDTANVTAAGALMDSELTDIDAVKALDQGVATADSPAFQALTIAGNIAVGGSVDGRDLAADGTKLDHLTVTQAVDLDAIEARVNALDAAVVLKGSWDASAGTFPGAGSAQAGESWVVSASGTVNGVQFVSGDRIIALTDNASTSVYASNWLKADYSDLVTSVAGRTGAITLAIGDITSLQTVLDGKQPLSSVLTATTASFTTALETKLNGIASGATANSSDATLLARANHTGTQAISTVSGLQDALDGKLSLAGGTLAGNFVIDKTLPLLALDADGASDYGLISLRTGGVERWSIAGPAGVNADLSINRVNSSGVYVDTPLHINGVSGVATFSVRPTVNGQNIALLNEVLPLTGGTLLGNLAFDGAAGTNRIVTISTGGLNRWTYGGDFTAEAGTNTGTEFALDRYADDGSWLGYVFKIKRNNGVVDFTFRPTVGGQNIALVSDISGGGTVADASDIVFTPTGAVAATNVQAAIAELDAEKASLALLGSILPGYTTSVQGTGIPGMNNTNWFLWNAPTGYDENITLRVDRHVDPATVSGTTGYTYSTLWVNATAGKNVNGWEWPLKATLDNYARASLATQNVAIAGTAFVKDNGVEETGATWGGNFVVDDRTNTVNPTAGRVGVEINCYAHPDGGTDANRARVGLQVAVGPNTADVPTTPLHFSRAFLIGANRANVIVDRLMEVSGSGEYGIGLDASSATFNGPVIGLAQTQRIALDLVSAGTYNRSIYYESGLFVYRTQNGVVFTVDDNGNASFAGNVSALNI